MNKKLEKTLRVLKKRGIAESTSHTELARLSGLTRQTISKLKPKIENYLQSASPPSSSDESFVDKQSISTYVDIALTSGLENSHFAQVTGAVAGFVLRHHTNLINDIQRPKKIVKVGQKYLSLVTQIEARKESKGTPIHSQNGSAKYLLTELNNSTVVEQLFSRSNSYRADGYSKRWKLQEKAVQINQLIMQETIKLIDKYNNQQAKVTHSPLHIGGGICSGKSVNHASATNHSAEHRYFNILISDLNKLSVRSFLQLMNIAEPSPPSYLSVPLISLSSVDPTLGRTYNIFTRLRSSERKAIGYNNYDISGGLQIICFNILYQYPQPMYSDFYDLSAVYKMIFDYGFNPDSKRALRQEIADDLGKSIDDVKALLTAYANGSQKDVGNSAKLKEFYEESDRLRREVIAVVAEQKPELLTSAITQSKKAFPEDMNWQSREKEKTAQEAKNKASVFFFIWTYYEKQIRDAMLSLVDDGIPVHDAIYSKHHVPFDAFQQAVYDQTGFDVKIGN